MPVLVEQGISREEFEVLKREVGWLANCIAQAQKDLGQLSLTLMRMKENHGILPLSKQ